MNHLKKAALLILMICHVGTIGCGVRGDPLPPLEPAVIGSGDPVQPNPQTPGTKKKNLDTETFEDQKSPNE